MDVLEVRCAVIIGVFVLWVQIDTGRAEIHRGINNLRNDDGLAERGFASLCHATAYSTEAHQSAPKARLPLLAQTGQLQRQSGVSS